MWFQSKRGGLSGLSVRNSGSRKGREPYYAPNPLCGGASKGAKEDWKSSKVQKWERENVAPGLMNHLKGEMFAEVLSQCPSR